MSKKRPGELVSNRRAFHDYEILETFEAGIVLVGTEVKSLRDHGGSLQDSYVHVSSGQVFLKNAHIALYKFGNIHNHEEKRERKLLLHKKEIKKITKGLQEKGLTVIPLAMYLSNKGYVKVKIGLAKGKKLYDKRASIQEREEKRSVNRMLKEKL